MIQGTENCQKDLLSFLMRTKARSCWAGMQSEEPAAGTWKCDDAARPKPSQQVAWLDKVITEVQRFHSFL